MDAPRLLCAYGLIVNCMSKYPNSGGRGRGRNFRPRGPRTNERIRAREIRVIGPDKRQVGLMSPDDARRMAKNAGLDLVEISPTARPPVCQIMDFGKYKYELSKKQKDNKTTTTKLKEVKLRVRIEEHDYMTKLRRAEEFLGKGNKLKITLQFRGREMEHQDIGFNIVNRAVKDLEHIGTQDMPPRRAGRSISLTVSPLPANKRKFIYNSGEPLEEEEHPESE